MSDEGFFVVIDGPSGIGKSTVTAGLVHHLSSGRMPALATTEPSHSSLGAFAREHTEEYRGLALACLVAADRYHHLEHEVRPALGAGHIVVCDRYLPSSLVLQRLDGVDPAYIWQLNQYADRPDLTVILTGTPERSRARSEARGTYSRFHRGDATAAEAEDELYRAVAGELRAAGYVILEYEVGHEPAEVVTSAVLDAVLARLS